MRYASKQTERPAFRRLVLLAGVFGVTWMAGCAGSSSSRLVSAAQFEEQFARVGRPESMHSCAYLGQRDGLAFLELRSMSSVGQRWTTRRIHTKVRDLEEGFRRKLPATEFNGGR